MYLIGFYKVLLKYLDSTIIEIYFGALSPETCIQPHFASFYLHFCNKSKVAGCHAKSGLMQKSLGNFFVQNAKFIRALIWDNSFFGLL